MIKLSGLTPLFQIRRITGDERAVRRIVDNTIPLQIHPVLINQSDYYGPTGTDILTRCNVRRHFLYWKGSCDR